ncbi:DUF3618 domain-containing protein [Actinoplanes sp. NPDC051513]|uniref:DUF3618 domain-containing protein n=1 Tax=Actinoplanes sp. NPDC051513 TaxID=3363908 RepID=UPI0037A10070
MSTAQDPQQLRAEIEQTRADLGETVEALAAKTDVKARAKGAASDAAGKAKEKLDDARHIAADRLAPAREQVFVLKKRAAQEPAVRKSLPIVGVAALALTGAILVATSRRKR